MKLWQRIFLISTAMVILGINAVSYVVINNDIRIALENRLENTSLILENTENSIRSSVLTYRVENNNFVVCPDHVESLANVVCNLDERKGLEITFTPKPSNNVYLYTDSPYVYQTSEYLTEGDSHYIFITKPMLIEGSYYLLTVKQDITNTFNQFDDMSSYIRNSATIIAAFIGFVLLFVIQIIMRPVRNINYATKRIADGDYSHRIKINDSSELGEVAENMNLMASAIEDNVNYIEELSDSRLTFISNMTHELKTPLTSIMGFANVLVVKADISDEERREYGKIIEAESKRLKTLTSKLMELVALSNTALETSLENLTEVLEEITSSFSPVLLNKNIKIDLKTADLSMDMDKELFKSLIYNILDNAIKASPENSLIEITTLKQFDQLEIRIQDHGVGIPADKLPHVMEAFYMGDKARSRKEGGAGIGLSLCKEICRAHHGRIFISSTPGDGTLIRLLFPLPSKGGRNEK
jgi:signal transduction histidine kinase